MGNKLSVLMALFILVFACRGNAQIGYQQTDSISEALYNSANWQELLHFGKTAIDAGDDFPVLRLRMGYAAFSSGNYSKALTHYNKVLETDGYNQTALYYSWLCNSYLNRVEEASFAALHLEDKTINGKTLKAVALTAIGTEASIKFTDILERGNSVYTRVFADLQLGYRWSLSQSVSWFKQQMNYNNLSQPGYYLRLNYIPLRKLNIIGAYQYTNSSFAGRRYENNAGLFGLKYADAYYSVQGDVQMLSMDTEKTRQYNLRFFSNLTGNLNLYSISRLSLLNVEHKKNIVFNQLAGFKPAKNFWLEAAVTLGRQNNYSEADGLYIYNGFDATKFKFASSGYFLIKQHVLLSLNYSLERKIYDILGWNYLQHSINGGITWNF